MITIHLTLKITSALIVETSVTSSNCFQSLHVCTFRAYELQIHVHVYKYVHAHVHVRETNTFNDTNKFSSTML